MADTTRELRRALVPLGVFVGIAFGLLWLLASSELRSLGGRLVWATAAALAAAVICAWLLQRRGRRRAVEPLRDVARDLVRLSELDDPNALPDDSDPEALGSALRRLTARAGDRVERLENEHEHLLTVLGSMSEGVLVADERGRAVLVNRSWRELFGVTGEVEGRTALEVTRQTALDRMIAETLSTGVGKQIELEVTRGHRRTVILTSSPLTDGAGVVVLANDLTPFLRVGEIRRDFVANVSHELKTPLSAIRGFAETLSDGALEDPSAARRFTAQILKQCQRLEALLSDLLTLSRLEHPAARSGWGELDMAAVMREAIDLSEEAVAERHLELVTDIRPVSKLQGDAEAMVRMCINLLENAIKYNRPRGKVEVKLAEVDGQVVLEVADTGIGIPKQSLERLFERFYRVDKGRSRDEGGTGLGLAIVKHAAQLHGGTVQVESDFGHGSRFRVCLPLLPSP